MKIALIHEQDIGFFASTMRKQWERMGHEVVVIQGYRSQIDDNAKVDYLLAEEGNLMPENVAKIKKELSETDFFILRFIGDELINYLKLQNYIDNRNSIYKVHGSELRERGLPWSLQVWNLDLYHKEPIVVGCYDWSLIDKYKGPHITCIERPLDFEIMPRKYKPEEPYVIHTPTGRYKKGTDELIPYLEGARLPYKIVENTPRNECLKIRAGSMLSIDQFGEGYVQQYGPYGMNTVESWYMSIPVIGARRVWDYVFHPEVRAFHIPVDKYNIAQVLADFKEDPKPFEKNKYVKRAHNPTMIAQQYLDLYEEISTR